jgi:tetratricopeptide (TPR) repeat protein
MIAASHARLWILCAVTALALVAGGVFALRWRRPSQSVELPRIAFEEDDFEEPVVTNPGYVGPRACAECHASRVVEFEKTRHFLACREPKAETMPPGFAAGRGKFLTHWPGLRFEMTQTNGKFRQEANQSLPDGTQESSYTTIALVYGAGGKGDEVYHAWDLRDTLWYLPMSWLHPLQCWGVSNSPYGDGNFREETTPRCLECHTTWFAHKPGTLNAYDPDSLILGVTCERCHSPGREHVDYNRAHPNADAAHAIVHPGRLTRAQQMDLCAQCHSNAVNSRGPPFSYRPGDPLENHFRSVATDHPEDDHVTNQVQYLRQSKCFQKSETLTCLTCHNPHRPTGETRRQGDKETRRQGDGQRACLTCHQPAQCGEQERLPVAVRGDCTGCHMPPRVWVNVYFHTQDDQYVPAMRRHAHRIAIDRAARDEVVLTWLRSQSDEASRKQATRLADGLVTHWLSEAESCQREYRFLAAIRAVREALRIDATPAARSKLKEIVAIQSKLDADLAQALQQIEERRFPEAIASLQEMLAVKPNSGKAHGRLGTVYGLLDQRDKAIEHLQAAAKYDPDETYAPSMLGWLAYLRGDCEEAAEHYRRAEEIEPYNAKIAYHLGLSLAKLERLDEAIAYFRRALTIDPKHAGACQGLSHALRQEGKAAEAVRYARRAARLTDYKNADVLVSLADAYSDAGRTPEAVQAAERALDVARTNGPNLVPQVQRRLEEWRSRVTP